MVVVSNDYRYISDLKLQYALVKRYGGDPSDGENHVSYKQPVNKRSVHGSNLLLVLAMDIAHDLLPRILILQSDGMGDTRPSDLRMTIRQVMHGSSNDSVRSLTNGIACQGES